MSSEDRLEIQELNFKYAYFIDIFEVDQWVDVFTEDAYFDETEFGNPSFHGHEEIRDYGRELARTVQHVVHGISNQLIFELTPTTARGVVFCLVEALMKTGERTRFHVRYEDKYVKEGDSWKIAQRVLRSSLPPEVVSTGEI